MDNGLEGISLYYKNVLSDNVVATIKDEIVNTEVDLLVMVPHKYGFGSLLYTEVRPVLWLRVVIFRYYLYLLTYDKSK